LYVSLPVPMSAGILKSSVDEEELTSCICRLKFVHKNAKNSNSQ